MKTNEVWSQNIPAPQDPSSNLTNQTMIVVVGDAILIYDSSTGDMLNKPIRNGHKDIINCVQFSQDGKRFVTGSNDKCTLIWGYNNEAEGQKVKGEAKIVHSDRILTIAINPLTGYVFSGGAADWSLWYPDSSQKYKKESYKDRIMCASWNKQGQILATGSFNGTLELWNRDCQSIVQVKKDITIACMDWTPITPEDQDNILVIGLWNQSIQYYNTQGQQLGGDKKLDFDPLSINFHLKGEIYALSGTNNKCQLYTRDSGYLIDVVSKDDWVWNCKFKNDSLVLGICTNNGDISVQKVQPLDVYTLYNNRYAYRDNLTDVVVENLSVNQKMRLKCKELVKGISLYKDKLLTYQQNRLIIYSSTIQQDGTFKYRITRKINKQFDSEQIHCLSSHLLSITKNKLQLLQFSGEVEREWVMESKINFLKIIGGPTKKETVIVGLNNGCVYKIFADNSFPVQIIQHNYGIKQCQLSLNMKQLAVIDINNNLTVFNTVTKETLQTEVNITSCMFNSDFNDSLVYCGQDPKDNRQSNIYVKTSTEAALQQKFQGEIIGFKKNRLQFKYY